MHSVVCTLFLGPKLKVDSPVKGGSTLIAFAVRWVRMGPYGLWRGDKFLFPGLDVMLCLL
jgi:hypothetical protein